MHATLLVRAFGETREQAAAIALSAANNGRWWGLGGDEEGQDAMFGWLRYPRSEEDMEESLLEGWHRQNSDDDADRTNIVSGTPWDEMIEAHGGWDRFLVDTSCHLDNRTIIATGAEDSEMWAAKSVCIAHGDVHGKHLNPASFDDFRQDSEFIVSYAKELCSHDPSGRWSAYRSWAFVFDVKEIL